ncbi:MAG: phenylacetic acid degradation protein [Rhodocyclales bacterium]|nr:phenylacetic acid degradation protein [Rhodocyclales bacterium]
MHVVIGIITALAGLIWALVSLQRSGFSLSSLDPFAWYRRMQWSKKYGAKPLYNLKLPLEVAAVLLLGVAKCEGEISTEQKKQLLAIFEKNFQQSPDEASDLLLASAHMIRNEIYLVDSLAKILEPSAGAFTSAHVQSLLSLMRGLSNLESPANQEQEKLIVATENYFKSKFGPKRDW